MVFVDPHSEAAAARQQRAGAGSTFSTLEPMLKSWGIDYSPDRVVADPQLARQVQYPVNGRPQVVDYLAWLSLPEGNLSKDLPITADLHTINLASAGWLKAADGATTKLTPLLTSSADAESIEADKVRLFPDPAGLLRDYKRGGVPMVIAARVNGPAKSAYHDALPDGVKAGDNRLKEAKEPIDVIVVADTDLLEDRSWLMDQSMFGQQVGIPVADNGDFVANAMDYLVGSGVFANLRGRDVTIRPFTKVAEIRRSAEAQYRAKEQELTQRLNDLQQKLSSMQVGDADEGTLLSADQKQELDKARGQLLETRRDLRDVQHALRSDIEDLRSELRFINIAAVPILVAVIAIIIALIRRMRFRRRFDAVA
jgi:ABC-type uncharacterized transport system involved in gliding motility auxiliary subunit